METLIGRLWAERGYTVVMQGTRGRYQSGGRYDPLRHELVSNASDAVDRLRFEALSRDELYEDDRDLGIRLGFDEAARTITISDDGIGIGVAPCISNGAGERDERFRGERDRRRRNVRGAECYGKHRFDL